MMARKARAKSKSGVYHIMVRGTNRQEIFHEEEDWIKFLNVINKYKIESQLIVYAWCLMGNHVHLLLKEGNENISNTMKRIQVSYAMYYNWKYTTTGHLFQGRFKSEKVETKRYLLTVVRYIHQNPVKAGIVKMPDEWKWSSCRAYYGKNNYPENMLDSQYLLKLFSTDVSIAKEWFKAFNQKNNNDQCLEDSENKRRLSDDEVRMEIRKLIGTMEIAHVKSLPKLERKEVLQKIKKIDGVSLRQISRILGIPLSLVYKA